MKVWLFFLLLFNVQHLIAQTNNDTVVTVRLGTGIDRIKEKEARISLFADSINNYTGGKLPRFLLNKCFDRQSNLWKGPHSSVSPRWKILEKVNNKEALKRILSTNDKRLKRKCKYSKDSEITMPMIKESFYQLLWKRYEQL